MNSDSGQETPEAVFAALRAAEALVSRPALESPGPHWEPGGTERQFVVAMLTSDDSVSESDHPFFGRVFVALRSRLMAMGCDLLVCARRPAMAEDMRVSRLERLLERGIDGFVVMSVGYSSTEVKLALESGKPAVFIDFDPIGEHVGCVMSANVDAMAAVIDHLHKTGHRRIAYVSGGSTRGRGSTGCSATARRSTGWGCRFATTTSTRGTSISPSVSRAPRGCSP